LFPQPSIGPTFELARPDLEMETLQRDLSAPASLSLLHRPLALLGGGEVENSGESGVGLVGPMCGEASVSAGGGGEGRGVDLEEIEGRPVLQEEVGVPCRAVGLQPDLGGAGLWVGAGLCRQGAGWEPPRCEHNHTRRPCPEREK